MTHCTYNYNEHKSDKWPNDSISQVTQSIDVGHFICLFLASYCNLSSWSEGVEIGVCLDHLDPIPRDFLGRVSRPNLSHVGCNATFANQKSINRLN